MVPHALVFLQASKYYFYMDAELKEHLQRMEARIVQAVTHDVSAATVGNLTDLRNELVGRMDGMERRMDSMERAMGHLNLTVSQLDVKVSSLNRLVTGMQNDNQADLSNQAALQRAVDDLAARVKQLEDRNAA